MVCVRRTSISVQVLPFGLSLSPCVFTKVAEAAFVPLREQGVRILNYLDDWLILAQSQDQLCEHRDLVLSHLSQLGLQVNWEKSKLLPMQRISFLGMELDSVNQTARLTQEHAQSGWTAWIRSRTGRRHHGNWGIWWLWSHRWGCSIWDRFNTGSMAESWGGRGRAARCGSKSLQPAAKPSPRGQTFHSIWQECPWNGSPGTLWFTGMPPPRAGGPRSMGLQCWGFGRVPNCTGI